MTVEAHVPTQSAVFEGHFPGYPIMPGVLLIESMAQASGWLLVALMNFERMPFLAAVKEAKMRGFVSPGEILTIDVSLVHEGSGYAIAKGRSLHFTSNATFDIGEDLDSPVSLDYYDQAPFPFNGTIGATKDYVSEKVERPRRVVRRAPSLRAAAKLRILPA